MDYKKKYLKYKEKYLNLKGGENNENLIFFFYYNSIRDITLDKYQKFSNLNLMMSPINPIGQGSANGFINLVKYGNLTDNHNFDAVIKTSRQTDADNNFYEFNVGRCINIIKQYFPNFVYTFLYFNLSQSLKAVLEPSGDEKRQPFTNLNYFKRNIQNLRVASAPYLINEPEIESGCENNSRASVLIENIPNSINFSELLRNQQFNKDYNYNIFCILFQIYAALYSLREIYTHYDLHTENVMFISLKDPIQIIYNLNDEEYILYTSFIPVIIDYGRSYVNCAKLDSTLISSEMFAEKACNTRCNVLNSMLNCKNTSLKIEKYNGRWYDMANFYYINPRVKNESHDLRYIGILMSKITLCDLKIKYSEKFNPTNNPDWHNKDRSISYGVKEHPSTDIKSHPLLTKIENTTDIMLFLTNYFKYNYKNTAKINRSSYTLRINCNIQQKMKWTFKQESDVQPLRPPIPPPQLPHLKFNQLPPSINEKQYNFPNLPLSREEPELATQENSSNNEYTIVTNGVNTYYIFPDGSRHLSAPSDLWVRLTKGRKTWYYSHFEKIGVYKLPTNSKIANIQIDYSSEPK